MNDKIKKMHEESTKQNKPFICATDEVLSINGNKAEILTLVTSIMRDLVENGMKKEDFESCIELCTKSEEELELILLNKIKKNFKKLFNDLGGEDNE